MQVPVHIVTDTLPSERPTRAGSTSISYLTYPDDTGRPGAGGPWTILPVAEQDEVVL